MEIHGKTIIITGAASGIGNVILGNFDAAVTFAKGLFGG